MIDSFVWARSVVPTARTVREEATSSTTDDTKRSRNAATSVGSTTPTKPLVHGCGRFLPDALDSSEDEIDASKKLRPVIVFMQPVCHLMHEWKVVTIEPLPLCGDHAEERRSIGVASQEAGSRSVLTSKAEHVVHER